MVKPRDTHLLGWEIERKREQREQRDKHYLGIVSRLKVAIVFAKCFSSLGPRIISRKIAAILNLGNKHTVNCVLSWSSGLELCSGTFLFI